MENEHKSADWAHWLNRAGGSLLGLAQSRCELFAVELQEEKLRALKLLIWLAVALTFGAAGLLTGLGALALWLWTLAGYAGLMGLMLVTLALATGLLMGIRHRLRTGPVPFAETVAEFQKDRECLRNDH
ncbi:MAG: phage holin family protein [Verrucomicrobiota bacterium]